MSRCCGLWNRERGFGRHIDVGGYCSRIGHFAVSWLNEVLIDNHQLSGQTKYRLHLWHLSESNVSGVIPCSPDRTQMDSYLGIDQLIVSVIQNEKDNVSSF